MSRFALALEYDGSHYHGWQIQSGVRTVQAELEKALSKFANEPIHTITAGRTDTGVHALNQVVHFTSSAKRQLAGWVCGVNANLPGTIRVKAVKEVAAEFDARYSALSRTYHYYLLLQPQNSALLKPYLSWYHKPLDVVAMTDAMQLLLGTHDFSAFRASACQANSPIRSLKHSQICQHGNILRFELTANAFLQHMVRNIIGALVYVGNQRLSVAEFKEVFVRADRRIAPPTFMPNGLYLVNVAYPEPIFSEAAIPWLFHL